MSFSTMRHWLAGGAMIVAVAGSAQAQQDPKAVFDARYTELSAAMLGKDATKVGAILAPDYQSTDIRGDTHDRADALDKVGKMPPEMADLKPVTKVLTVKQNGDSADVENEMTLQMKRPGEDGEEMTLDIKIVSADVWVQRGGVWLLQKSVQKQMTVSKDGEVVFSQAN